MNDFGQNTYSDTEKIIHRKEKSWQIYMALTAAAHPVPAALSEKYIVISKCPGRRWQWDTYPTSAGVRRTAFKEGCMWAPSSRSFINHFAEKEGEKDELQLPAHDARPIFGQ